MRDLAHEMSVSEKTIRRDIEHLRSVGFPIDERIGKRGKKAWRIANSANSDPLGFTYDEALVLYLARQFLEPLAGGAFAEAAEQVFAKIKSSLGQVSIEYLDRMLDLVRRTRVGGGDYRGKRELLEQLLFALDESKAVHVLYQSLSATEPATRTLHPCGLVDHRGSLYLFAYAPEHREIRHYKVDRISDVEVSEITFERPVSFDLAVHLSRSFGIFAGKGGDSHVVVRFDPSVARYVSESIWHPSQRLEFSYDGSLTAEFHLSSTDEIKRWILGFAAKTEVLSPHQLREEIFFEAQSLIDRHLPSSTSRTPKT